MVEQKSEEKQMLVNQKEHFQSNFFYCFRLLEFSTQYNLD
jgi:hypothetical protein